ncbi:MAG: tRNA dihydrouridine synthase DusB [Pseudomonadota bacterium]
MNLIELSSTIHVEMSSLGFNIGALRLENPLIMAPMAGITNLPFRILVREKGAALVVTEMVSAAGLGRRGNKTWDLMASSPREQPLAVQIFGHEPAWLARAAALAEEEGAAVVDINMGCPARKVIRSGNGCALLKDFPLIARIVSEVRQAVKIPLTVKTRSGWSSEEGRVEGLLPILADLGVDAVVVHPRFGVQGFSGQADWDVISRAVEIFPGPVIGNGDVTRPQHVLTMLKSTGCAGVMIGRAALGNPWIFSQSLDLLQGRAAVDPDLAERSELTRRHALLLREYIGPKRASQRLRSILMWYTKGLADSSTFRRSINQEGDFERLIEKIESYFDMLSTMEFPWTVME